MSDTTSFGTMPSTSRPANGQEAEGLLNQLLDHTSNGVCCYDLEGRIRWVNPAFEQLLGYREQQVIGKVPSEFLMGPASDLLVITRLREQRRRGEPSDEELVHYDSNGQPLRLRLRCIPLKDSRGRVEGYLGLQTDITQMHRALMLSHSQLELLEAVAAGQSLDKTLRDLCLTIEGAAVQVRSSLLLLDDVGRTIVAGQGPSLPASFMLFTRGLKIGEGVGTCGTAMWRRKPVMTPSIAQEPAWEGFREHPHALGLDACLSMPILDGDDNPLGSFAFYAETGEVFDATHHGLLEVAVKVARLAIERYRRDQQLTHQALHDSLTGLPNRRLVRRHLCELAEQAQPSEMGALMFLDLDHFKRLNDILGHDAGDLALKQVASRLAEMLGPQYFLARHGGDEFIVLLAPRAGGPREAASRARQVAEQMLERLQEPLELEGRTHQLTGSLGITLYPRHEEGYGACSQQVLPAGKAEHDEIDREEGDAWSHLLHQADIALYESKGAGRARLCFFAPEMRQRIIDAARMEHALREAVSRQQLSVHLQPQFSLPESGEPQLCGAEALLRWHDPQLGMVSPATFIPIAEESGLILELGHWVLEQVCRELAAMTARGYALPMAVNVSQVQFRSSEFVPQVTRLLAQHDFAPELLRMEITESLATDDEAAMLEKIDQLAALGLSFSIDDFGIGYSNLSRLRRMPLKELKIDRSFINDLSHEESPDTHTTGNEIVRAMLMMASALSLDVVAEGVEETEQLEVLRRMGCSRVQGYLLGRPRPMAEVIGDAEARLSKG